MKSIAACPSENKVETLVKLDPTSSENGGFSTYLKPTKLWLFSQFQRLNFFAILLALVSVVQLSMYVHCLVVKMVVSFRPA